MSERIDRAKLDAWLKDIAEAAASKPGAPYQPVPRFPMPLMYGHRYMPPPKRRPGPNRPR